MLIANFSMEVEHHSLNEIPGRSKCYVLKCTVAEEKNEDKRIFFVPLFRGDCGKFKKLNDVFEKRKGEYNVVIIEDMARKHDRMTDYVLKLISMYEKKVTDQQGAIVVDRVGHVNILLEDGRKGTFYVGGPNFVLPSSHNVTREDVKKLDLIWMGDATVTDLRIASLDTHEHDSKKWLNKIMQSHGDNVGSFCLLIGQAFLSMNIPELSQHGIKLASAHLIGEMSTGKSIMASDLQSMFPQKHIEGNLIPETDRKMSAAMLAQESAKVRPPNIQDPPITDKSRLEAFIDDIYERKLPINARNARSFENAEVNSSAVIVWRNEDRQLAHFGFTSLSKSLIVINEKHDGEMMGKLQELRETCTHIRKASSALYAHLVMRVDMARMKKDAEHFRQIYRARLEDNYPDIGDHPRILDTYSTIQAGYKQWIDLIRTADEESYEDELTNYIVDRCLPWLMERLQSEKEREIRKDTLLQHSRDDVEKALAEHIEAFALGHIFRHISFQMNPKSQVRFAKSLWKTSTKSQVRESEIIMKEMGPVQRVDFSNADPSTIWYSRRFIENSGDWRRKYAYIVDAQFIPNSIFDAVLSQMIKVFPDGKFDRKSDFKALLDTEFNKTDKKKGTGHSQSELVTIFKSLNEVNAKALLSHAKTLLCQQSEEKDEEDKEAAEKEEKDKEEEDKEEKEEDNEEVEKEDEEKEEEKKVEEEKEEEENKVAEEEENGKDEDEEEGADGGESTNSSMEEQRETAKNGHNKRKLDDTKSKTGRMTRSRRN